MSLVFALLAGGCHDATPSGQAPNQGANGPAIEFLGIAFSGYEGSQKAWTLRAEHLEYDNQIARLASASLDSFQSGRLVSMAQAPSASFEVASRNLQMSGRVKMHSTVTKTAFSADTVVWHAGSQQLHASGKVVFNRGSSLLLASELDADRHLRRVHLGGPVHATVSVALPDVAKELSLATARSEAAR